MGFGVVLGYASAVLHWTYFTSLRRHGLFWLELVAWGAVAGALMTLAGLVVGTVRVRQREHRLRSGTSYSPYAG